MNQNYPELLAIQPLCSPSTTVHANRATHLGVVVPATSSHSKVMMVQQLVTVRHTQIV